MTEPEEENKYRIITMDDPEWSTTPRVEYKMSEEMKAKNDRDYPRRYNPYFDSVEYLNRASYLRNNCHYCAEEFFLISPYREKGKNPYNEGFIVKPEKSKLKKLVFSCRKCYVDLCNKDEHVWINGLKDG